MKPFEYFREKKACILSLSFLVILASIFRYNFVTETTLSEFDPWRHLQLIKNIQHGYGFTLFDGQPYIWYNEVWYYVAAMLGPAENVQWVSCWLSVLSLTVFYVFLLRTEQSLAPAVAGGLMIAAYGPVVAFTCTYGSESLAFFLLLFSFLLATYRTRFLPVFFGGLFFGIALASRMNFIFNCFILLPILKTRRSILTFTSGVAVILLSGWWTNYRAISTYDYVFTWDGLATKSSDYGILSTLIPQLHPAVASATRTLHQAIAPVPFDLYSQGQFVWGNVIFITVGILCLILSKRWSLIMAGLLPFIYFTFFDKSLISNFYRIYLGVFPALFMGVAVTAERMRQNRKVLARISTFVWLSLILCIIFSGVRYLRPQRMIKLETATPPPEILTKQYYMVNSGFYHPESLIYRYPGKHFIGMPLDPRQFDDFSLHYPQYTTIIWHKRYSVQDDLLQYLTGSGKYKIVNTASNKAGLFYLFLERSDGRDMKKP